MEGLLCGFYLGIPIIDTHRPKLHDILLVTSSIAYRKRSKTRRYNIIDRRQRLEHQHNKTLILPFTPSSQYHQSTDKA